MWLAYTFRLRTARVQEHLGESWGDDVDVEAG
jgi:hypothetical protein